MSDFLQAMTEESVRRATLARESESEAELQDRAREAVSPAPLSLAPEGFDVIAEVKAASPSEGRLMPAASGQDEMLHLANRYAGAGAVAVSVLTEETRFDGSLADLETVAAAVPVPVMRKDFLVDPIQVLEARAAGASGVLLIARMLPGSLLEEMTDLALGLGMFVLVEVFDRSDLENAVPVFDRDVLVGVNSRDLVTLEVDPTRFESLAPHLPDHLPAVAESGIVDVEGVVAVADLGYRLALVGSSLVRSPDPATMLRDLVDAGRARAVEVSS